MRIKQAGHVFSDQRYSLGLSENSSSTNSNETNLHFSATEYCNALSSTFIKAKMGQCQSNCKSTIPETVVIFPTANVTSTGATFVKSHPPLQIDTSFPPNDSKSNDKARLRVQVQNTPSTVSMNSRSTPASSYQENALTPLNNEELKEALNPPRTSKSKQRKRRSRSHSMNEAYPSSKSAIQPTSFIPVVSLNACSKAFIPEEKDPDAPSDEEENHRDVELQRKLEQPHMRYQRHTWIHTAKSGVSPLSIELPSLPPIPPDNKAVHPQALSHFQKLKIAAEVATKQMKRQQRISAEEERVQDIYDQRQRWTEYEAIQISNSERNQDLHSSTNQQDSKKKRREKQNHSFDLSDTDSWYFDFQGHEFDVDGREFDVDPYCDDDSTSQASLSLLSQSSMEAQRRLYAEKARKRGNGKSRSVRLRSGSVDGKSVRSANSVPRNDYGPKEKLISRTAPIDTIEGLELEFTSRVTMRNDDDRSQVSDIAEGYSFSNSTNFTETLNNDYGVARRKYRMAAQVDDADSRNSVDPRFEETLRAVKAGRLTPDDRVISTKPSISSRLDAVEKQLAAVEQCGPDSRAAKIRKKQEKPDSKERRVSSLISVFETSTDSGTKSSTIRHQTQMYNQSNAPPPNHRVRPEHSTPLLRTSNQVAQPNLSAAASVSYKTRSTHRPVDTNIAQDAPRQESVRKVPDTPFVNSSTPTIYKSNHNGSSADNVASRSNEIQNIVPSGIALRKTAERARRLSTLVDRNSDPNRLAEPRKVLCYPSYSLKSESTKSDLADDVKQKYFRESRIPRVLGPSKEEFLQCSETFRDTYNPSEIIHYVDSNYQIDSPSLSENASIYSDSSTSEFGEIMAMKPTTGEDKKKRRRDPNNFADLSLLRAEKVEAQVNDVLTKYRESSA
jgi:hypothetical protein